MPELSRVRKTLPAESVTSREGENCFYSFPYSPLDVSFALPQTRSKGSLYIHSPWFGCKESHARILACTKTRLHTGTHTLILYIQTESNRVFWAVTNRPTRVQARGLSSLAKWSTTHPIHQLSLWVWDTDPGSAYCSQKLILKPTHNTGSSYCLISAVR